MKSTEEILIEKDCYQSNLYNLLDGRIISTDVNRFKDAMIEFAKQVIDEVANMCEIRDDNWNRVITYNEVLKVKEQLR